MHPAVIQWWNHRHSHGCGEGRHEAHAGPGWGRGHRGESWEAGGSPDEGGGGGGFGVGRPLRVLAFKLELDEAQVEKLARVLDELKIERAQGAVDHRRTSAALADAIEGDTLDSAGLAAAAADRVKSAQRLGDAVTKALSKIHELLTPKQRTQLAYLVRTGTLSI